MENGCCFRRQLYDFFNSFELFYFFRYCFSLALSGGAIAGLIVVCLFVMRATYKCIEIGFCLYVIIASTSFLEYIVLIFGCSLDEWKFNKCSKIEFDRKSQEFDRATTCVHADSSDHID